MRTRQVQAFKDQVHLPDIFNACLRQGDTVRAVLPYGVGIDCHSQFIQVCVLQAYGDRVMRHEWEFATRWGDLQHARDWALALVKVIDKDATERNLRYVIESTGTYHMPVLLAWKGTPSVINPQLAGATKRKTDVLDARLLAQHSLCGLWPSSFVLPEQAEILRIIISMRREMGRNATRCTNRIGNHLLRFGHTIGRDGSVADSLVRAAVEDMCEGRMPMHESLHPAGIPKDARSFFIDTYKLYDHFASRRLTYQKRAIEYVHENSWPIAGASIAGKELLKCLTSVPGVGIVSALTWLSVIIDPNRFADARALSAFCGCDPSLKVSAGKVTSFTKRKGNANLHRVLKNVAAQVVRRHNDPIGQWGFSIFRRHAKGGMSKAINAVARRLAVFLWHVHRNGAFFSYEQYRFMLVPEVPEVSVAEMGLGSRYTAMLLDAGLNTSTEVARASSTTLPQTKGFGAGCLSQVREWLEANRTDRSAATSTKNRVSPTDATRPNTAEFSSSVASSDDAASDSTKRGVSTRSKRRT